MLAPNRVFADPGSRSSDLLLDNLENAMIYDLNSYALQGAQVGI